MIGHKAELKAKVWKRLSKFIFGCTLISSKLWKNISLNPNYLVSTKIIKQYLTRKEPLWREITPKLIRQLSKCQLWISQMPRLPWLSQWAPGWAWTPRVRPTTKKVFAKCVFSWDNNTKKIRQSRLTNSST